MSQDHGRHSSSGEDGHTEDVVLRLERFDMAQPCHWEILGDLQLMETDGFANGN